MATGSSDDNGARLLYLIVRVATRAVREYFDKEIHPDFLQNMIHTHHDKLNRLHLKRIVSTKQWRLLFPSQTEKAVSSANFDLQTMFLLLRNLTGVKITDNLPLPGDSTIESHLERINYYRKKILYSQSDMSNSNFTLAWDDITMAIAKLSEGHLKDECESLLTAPLPGPDEKGEKLNSVGRPCDVCEYKGMKNSSDFWCLNCDESLCKQCHDHHISSKLSRLHQCVKIEEYFKNPSMSTITCSKHNEHFDLFCEIHCTPLCFACLIHDHHSCHSIKPIQMAIERSDVTKHDLYAKGEKLSQNVDVITKDIQAHLKGYEDEKGKVKGQLRKQLKSAAEEVEKQCLKEISQYENATNIIFRNLSKQQKEIKRLLKTLSTHKEQNIRSFVLMLEIGDKIQKQDENIRCLLRDKVINTFHVATDVDSLAVKNIVCSIREISLCSALNTLEESGAQQEKETGIIKIADFNVEYNIKDNDIRGCAIINEDVVSFVDRGNNRLIFMTIHGYQKDIKLTCEPVDIVTVDSAKVAVSLYDNTIKIMNIETWKWEDFSYSDENTIGGLAFYENQIFSRVGGIGYLIIDLSGKVQQTITIEGSNMPYVSVSQDKLYSAKWDTGEIFCFDLQGKTNWKFENKTLVNPPNGITTDMEGNAYVTGSFSNNVIFISADGKETKEIISSSENLKNPIAIDYDKKTDRLLVSVASGLGCLFLMKNK